MKLHTPRLSITQCSLPVPALLPNAPAKAHSKDAATASCEALALLLGA